jgi:hypothetical protein
VIAKEIKSNSIMLNPAFMQCEAFSLKKKEEILRQPSTSSK